MFLGGIWKCDSISGSFKALKEGFIIYELKIFIKNVEKKYGKVWKLTN